MKYPLMLPLAVLALAGCAEKTGSKSTAAVRDSGGITIVENGAALSAPVVPMDTVPALNIGGNEQGQDYDFSQVVGAVRLSDGKIVVADIGSAELRYYDSAGSFIRRAGRKGSGPGEFQALGLLWSMPADSVLAYDAVGRRASIFDSAGTYVRSVDLSRAGFLQPMGRMGDGTIVALGFSFNPDSMPPEGSLYRSQQPVLLVGSDSTLDTLGVFPGIDMYTVSMNFGGRSFPAPMMVNFGHITTVQARGDRIYLGDNARFEVAVYGRDGHISRLIRAGSTPESVTEADRNSALERNREAMMQNASRIPAAMRDQLETLLGQAKYAEQFPPFETIRLDQAGNLWVQHYARHRAPIPYTVFDSTGSMISRVTLPARFQPMEIGTNYILGVWTDDDDLPHVVLYRSPTLQQEVTGA